MQKSNSRIIELTSNLNEANQLIGETVQTNMKIILKSLKEIKGCHTVLSCNDWELIRKELIHIAMNQKQLFDAMKEIVDIGIWLSEVEKSHSEFQDYSNGIYKKSKNKSNCFYY
jgi:glutamate racemase